MCDLYVFDLLDSLKNEHNSKNLNDGPPLMAQHTYPQELKRCSLSVTDEN